MAGVLWLWKGNLGTGSDIRPGDTQSLADGLHFKKSFGRESERNNCFFGPVAISRASLRIHLPSSSCPAGAATPSPGPEAPGIRKPERPPPRRPSPSAPLETPAFAMRTTGSAECRADGQRRRIEQATVAVEWTITIDGKNEFGDVYRREVRVDKVGSESLHATDALRSAATVRPEGTSPVRRRGRLVDRRGQEDHAGATERGRESRGRNLLPLSSGLPGLTTRSDRIRTVFGTVEGAIPAGCCAGIVTRA